MGNKEWREADPFFGERWWHLIINGLQAGSVNEFDSSEQGIVYVWSVGEPGDCCRRLASGHETSLELAMGEAEKAILEKRHG